MENIRKRIKGVILKHAGLPGYSRSEYLTEMKRLIRAELPPKDLAELKRLNIDLIKIIMELSREIAEEIL